MNNASESALARIKNLFPTTRLWIIPTSLPNIPEAVNGKILQRQWDYMVDYKKTEMLDTFRAMLQGEASHPVNLAQVGVEYARLIGNATGKMKQLAADIQRASHDDTLATNFPAYMERLEMVNYPNADYQKLYKEYKAMITDPHFNYSGFDSLSDVSVKVGGTTHGANESTYKTYQVLLHVWSYATRQLSVEDLTATPNEKTEIGPVNQTKMRALIQKVRGILEAAQAKDGSIKLDGLPGKGKDTEDVIEKDWLGSTAIFPNSGLWISK